jgi:magnesium transporter
MRHLRSRIRASLYFHDDEAAGPSTIRDAAQVSDDALSRTVSQQERGVSDSDLAGAIEEAGRSRARSVSDTLGDFFRTKRNRRKSGPITDADEDASRDTLPGP